MSSGLAAVALRLAFWLLLLWAFWRFTGVFALLLAHLQKERAPDAIRFSTLIEREIVFPVRRERKRFGIKPAAPGFRAGE